MCVSVFLQLVFQLVYYFGAYHAVRAVLGHSIKYAIVNDRY